MLGWTDPDSLSDRRRLSEPALRANSHGARSLNQMPPHAR